MDEAYGTIEGTNLDMLITAYVSNYHVVSPSMAYAHASVVDDGTCFLSGRGCCRWACFAVLRAILELACMTRQARLALIPG